MSLEQEWEKTKQWARSLEGVDFIALNTETRLPQYAVIKNPHYHELQLASFFRRVQEIQAQESIESERCTHDRLNEDGICRGCGEDCRRGS